METDLYDRDFYSWTQEQARLLRSGHLAQADLNNIAEEIETLGRSEARALEAAYRLIAMHLLKAIYQPTRATASWETTIVRERSNVIGILEENPGLKPRRPEIFERAYRAARKEASSETRLDVSKFPPAPPFTIEQVEDERHLPASLRALRRRDAEREAGRAKGPEASGR